MLRLHLEDVSKISWRCTQDNHLKFYNYRGLILDNS